MLSQRTWSEVGDLERFLFFVAVVILLAIAFAVVVTIVWVVGRLVTYVTRWGAKR